MAERYVVVDRETPMLLPVDLREWVAEDDLARLVIELVEQSDLRTAWVNERGSGSAQYPPGMMLGLLIYAYARGIYSSRRIEQLSYESISVRYLCANTHPDHDTIAKFRRQNGKLFRQCFGRLLKLARELGLVRIGKIGVDGTRLEADANRHRFSTRNQLEHEQARLDGIINELLERAETADQAEDQEPEESRLPPELADAQKRRAAVEQALERIKEKEKQQQQDKEKLAQRGRQSEAKEVRMNLTDPDCAILHRKGQGTVVGYNAQIGVDMEGSGLIVSNTVSAKGADAELLIEVLGGLNPALGKVQQVVVDSGYESGLNAYRLEKSSGVKVYYPPRPTHHSTSSRTYRANKNKRLARHMRSLMQRRINSNLGQWLQHRRQTLAEGAFGFIKRTLGFKRFSLRGLEAVQTEWQLICLAFNLRKLA
jgi:transposase